MSQPDDRSRPYDEPADEGPERVEQEPGAVRDDVPGAGQFASPGAPTGGEDPTAGQTDPRVPGPDD